MTAIPGDTFGVYDDDKHPKQPRDKAGKFQSWSALIEGKQEEEKVETTMAEEQEVYRAHDYIVEDGKVPRNVRGNKLAFLDGRWVDTQGRPYKPVGMDTQRPRWVVDDEAYEEMRKYAMEKYYDLKKKAEAGEASYRQAKRNYFRQMDVETESMRMWSPQDIAEMFHATAAQIRSWMKRTVEIDGKQQCILDHVVINGHYFSSSDQVMAFWQWARQHELNLYRYAGTEFSRLARQSHLNGHG